MAGGDKTSSVSPYLTVLPPRPFLSSLLSRCLLPLQNVSILIANRTEPGLLFDVEEELIYVCKKDFYGEAGSCPACRCTREAVRC